MTVDGSPVLIFLLILLICGSAFFSASETALTSLSKIRLRNMVDENVKMYRLVKGFSQIEEIDVKEVEAKYGILKSQFLDLKALKGDRLRTGVESIS